MKRSSWSLGRSASARVSRAGLDRNRLPSRRLAATNICSRLLCLLAEARSAVGILFADRPAVGQVLGAVDDNDERADFGAVNAHVREDACCVHLREEGIDLGLVRHGRGADRGAP